MSKRKCNITDIRNLTKQCRSNIKNECVKNMKEYISNKIYQSAERGQDYCRVSMTAWSFTSQADTYTNIYPSRELIDYFTRTIDIFKKKGFTVDVLIGGDYEISWKENDNA